LTTAASAFNRVENQCASVARTSSDTCQPMRRAKLAHATFFFQAETGLRLKGAPISSVWRLKTVRRASSLYLLCHAANHRAIIHLGEMSFSCRRRLRRDLKTADSPKS
jgi:hypothetical protein